MKSERPVIGITMDASETDGRVRLSVGQAYCQSVAEAGGVPILLPPIVALIGEQLAMVDGVVFTGGGDPRMEAFGEATHPAASCMHEMRQTYEMALLEAINGRGEFGTLGRWCELPVLGICLGMQMMALNAGGRLDQHLPDTLATASEHRGQRHAMSLDERAAKVLGISQVGQGAVHGQVDSFHHQGVRDPGRLEVLARSNDGVIEAIADPRRPGYVGVQWHPERTADVTLGRELFKALVQRARERRASAPPGR